MAERTVCRCNEGVVSFAVADGLGESDNVSLHGGTGDESDGIISSGVNSNAGRQVPNGNGERGFGLFQGLLTSKRADIDE